jgi:hypothetical protein
MRPLTPAFAAAYLPPIAGLGLMARPVIGPSQTAPRTQRILRASDEPHATAVTSSIWTSNAGASVSWTRGNQHPPPVDGYSIETQTTPLR